MILRKYGSRCPTVGALKAAKTLGAIAEGPGPIKMRDGGATLAGNAELGMGYLRIEDRGWKIEDGE
jgi:hypothetical protein